MSVPAIVAPIEVAPAPSQDRQARHNEPVTVGVPLPRGACADPLDLVLLDQTGTPHPLQTRPLDHWADGSIRWLLVDFQASHDGGEHLARYDLCRAGSAPASPIGPLRVSELPDGTMSVETGAAAFRLSSSGKQLFNDISISGLHDAVDPLSTAFEIEGARGTRMAFAIDRAAIEDPGPLRAVIRLDAHAIGDSPDDRVLLVCRLHFYAGSPVVKFVVTLNNPRRAVHANGFWELGDRGSITLRDASFVVSLQRRNQPAVVMCSPELRAPLVRHSDPLELFQASSGGENWQSRVHVNREGIVPLAFRGYRLRSGASAQQSLRATPIVSIHQGAHELSLAIPKFWQNFPKAVEARDRSLVLRLFPRQHGELHELQGGEQKTHEFFVAFGRDDVTETPLGWTRAPLLARATSAHCCSSGAVPYLLPTAEDPHGEYLRLVDSAIEGDHSFERKREAIDEYGWRHYGDLYADHEAVFAKDEPPVVSHYNNQYDAVAGFAYQFMRSGDARWRSLMCELAAHVADIDIYHTDRDKSAFNHGLFWHTFHYIDAGLSTHRSYPRRQRVGGGGPSNEHNYSTGLTLHHFLTGDPISREVAVDLARWVIDMDDGRKTVFRWLASGDTGLASQTASASYHGPGRGAGNSIVVLLNGHRLTKDPVFLRKAESLIRRCIHPMDDIERCELLDTEQRWSYTVFLRALGSYLDHKAELSECDEMYAYAKRALLAYSTWMVAHEYPYLDQPEKLEYPTETWAAQELWKSEVFDVAAKHAEGAVRDTFFERADFFFNYSLRTLWGMPTRSLTRPVVLLLSRGFMRAYLGKNPDLRASREPEGLPIGAPSIFVPQKAIAMRRAGAIALGGFFAAAAGLWWVLTR